MPLQHTPLDPTHLSAAVSKVAGPGAPPPARMMAARGLAPMGPGDLVTSLYQLGLDADPQISSAARTTAEGLPDSILAAALGEPLDPRVLDRFSTLVISRGELIEKVLLNRAAADQTFITLARELPERELEIMAGNQERLLRCPAIIEAIYFNRKARMSTVDRLVEMAVRHGLTLDGIPQFKAIAAAIEGTAAPETAEQDDEGIDAAIESSNMDDMFDVLLNEEWEEGPIGTLEYDTDSEAEEKAKRLTMLPVNQKIRLAALGNAFHRTVLIRDSNRSVAMAAIQSPSVSEQEAARYAANRGLSEEIIRYIATKKEWQKNYQIKVSLVNNAKCPLAHSLKLLRHLRQNDVRAISRSKNVPAALANAAKQSLRRR